MSAVDETIYGAISNGYTADTEEGVLQQRRRAYQRERQDEHLVKVFP